jgi:hypothetical protein
MAEMGRASIKWSRGHAGLITALHRGFKLLLDRSCVSVRLCVFSCVSMYVRVYMCVCVSERE